VNATLQPAVKQEATRAPVATTASVIGAPAVAHPAKGKN
jgi:hypothetical protein